METAKSLRILRMPEVLEKIGLCKASIYNRVADGTFPKPVRLGGRSVGWLESALDQWIIERSSSSLKDLEIDQQ
jgi:prophage regulatory protein